jgi:hypothetical protein
MSKQQSEGVNAYRMLSQRLREDNDYQTDKTHISAEGEPKKQRNEKLDLGHTLKMRKVYKDHRLDG